MERDDAKRCYGSQAVNECEPHAVILAEQGSKSRVPYMTLPVILPDRSRRLRQGDIVLPAWLYDATEKAGHDLTGYVKE